MIVKCEIAKDVPKFVKHFDQGVVLDLYSVLISKEKF